MCPGFPGVSQFCLARPGFRDRLAVQQEETMRTFITAILFCLSLSGVASAEGVTHHVAIHVDQNDPRVMNLALNNVVNITRYYESVGDTVDIEVVAYGPGLNMYIEGKSPVADRISVMSLEMEHVAFSACSNTRRKMTAKAGHEIPIMDEASMVPSGVVRLIELQENGYAYIRP
jgi:intracellular sulfur oxidation DsrE/DsrF family protein